MSQKLGRWNGFVVFVLGLLGLALLECAWSRKSGTVIEIIPIEVRVCLLLRPEWCPGNSLPVCQWVLRKLGLYIGISALYGVCIWVPSTCWAWICMESAVINGNLTRSGRWWSDFLRSCRRVLRKMGLCSGVSAFVHRSCLLAHRACAWNRKSGTVIKLCAVAEKMCSLPRLEYCLGNLMLVCQRVFRKLGLSSGVMAFVRGSCRLVQRVCAWNRKSGTVTQLFQVKVRLGLLHMPEWWPVNLHLVCQWALRKLGFYNGVKVLVSHVDCSSAWMCMKSEVVNGNSTSSGRFWSQSTPQA